MMRSTLLPSILPFLLAALVVAPAQAQTGGSGGADADTTATRKLISTDGSVSVFEETTPGEGIEGFWWEFDPEQELARLLDQNRREEVPEPIVDAFGFELSIPDTILALRDSVFAVADSILAETIETAVRFDPKFRSWYTESKDVFVWNNEFDVAVPLTLRGSAIVKVTSKNDFNESTQKFTDDRNLSTSFNYTFQNGFVSSFGVNRTLSLQERGSVRESNSTNTVLTGSVRGTRIFPRVGTLEAGAGLSVNKRDYSNLSTDGISDNFTPNWSVKANRTFATGNVSVDYSGDRGRAKREETITTPTGDFDENGDPIVNIVTTNADERNLKNQTSLVANWDPNEFNHLRVNGSFARDRFQYLSAADSLRGQQETRRRAAQSVKIAYDTTPFERLDIRSWAEVRQSETSYELETARLTRTTTQAADVNIVYGPWEEGELTVKMFSSVDNREYVSNQSGLVYAQKASADFEQGITPNLTASAAYFITLDAFEFDDPVSNSGDRDLKKQRGLFVVRWLPPVQNLSTALNMDIRQDETINIHPTRSGDNRVDYTYIITPDYSWKIGSASITGNFNADVRYKIFDFRVEDDELTRRFSMGQRWQQQFTPRLSTDVLWNYEYTDLGQYPKDEDGQRRYVRTSELRRLRLDLKLIYNPYQGLKTNVAYRRDADDRFVISEGERILSSQPRTSEFSFGFIYKRNFTRHVSVDIDFRQSHKAGALATVGDDRFYNIRASIRYQPFREVKDDTP
jgi:hypothetical protein